MTSENNAELIVYQEFCRLQSKYNDVYSDLEINYLECGCLKCRLRLVTIGMELISLNAQINHLEEKLTPGIGEILEVLQIEHNTINGKTSI